MRPAIGQAVTLALGVHAGTASGEAPQPPDVSESPGWQLPFRMGRRGW